MKYMLLIYDEERVFPTLPEKERAEWMGAFRNYTENLMKSGAFLIGHQLSPTSTATTLRKGAKDMQVLDGPFAETKEQLGGFYLIEAPDLDAAIKWARQCPGAQFGAV